MASLSSSFSTDLRGGLPSSETDVTISIFGGSTITLFQLPVEAMHLIVFRFGNIPVAMLLNH